MKGVKISRSNAGQAGSSGLRVCGGSAHAGIFSMIKKAFRSCSIGLDPVANHRRRGFTLIEIMITMSIMFIIMGTVAGSGADRRMQFNISINQEKLRALLMRAKSLSMNSLFQAGSEDCGYGVHLDQFRAVIFIDRGPVCNYRFDGGEQVAGSSNEVIPREGIYFANMDSGNAVPRVFGDIGYADIVFVPPDPTTYVNGDPTRGITLGVLSSADLRDQVKVRVESSGLVTTRAR